MPRIRLTLTRAGSDGCGVSVQGGNWSTLQTVGDLSGVTFAALLKMYTFYANNYIAVRTPDQTCHEHVAEA